MVATITPRKCSDEVGEKLNYFPLATRPPKLVCLGVSHLENFRGVLVLASCRVPQACFICLNGVFFSV